MRIRSVLMVLFLMGAEGVACQSAGDHLIVPGIRLGPVSAERSEQELVKMLGSESVQRIEMSVGEGQCAPGSLLFPGTDNEIEVGWTDSTFSLPTLVRIRNAKGAWSTAQGVKVGSLLSELERIKGSVIEFSGFGWDGSGGGSWSESGGEIGFVLVPDSVANKAASRDPRQGEILGDRIVRSDHPFIRILKPSIARIALRFRPWRTYFDCR
jgi:hypothetical protein